VCLVLFMVNERILPKKIITYSPEETAALAGSLAAGLSGGEVIGLSGDLGSGKTCFTQGLAVGLGVKGRVRSPSFIVMASYRGRLRLHHADFYRLGRAEELEELGLEDCVDSGSVLVVEWAEKFRAQMPKDTMWLKMESRNAQVRSLKFGKGFSPDLVARVFNA
jgi:tRNA threonylcarbamoyladenosine biosynthesis protein TsaE